VSSRFRFLLVGVLIVILFSGLAALSLPRPHPPTVSLENAKLALDQASKADALRYAEQPYRMAEELMQKGWREMARQNGRLTLFRNYEVAESLLALAVEKAHQAAFEAQQRVCYLDSTARSERADLQNELLIWREALDGSLTSFQAQRYWSLADMSLEMSKLLIDEGEYEEARQTVEKGKESLRQLGQILVEYVNDEAEKISLWRRWVQETIAESRKKGTYAVIVDKSVHKTYLVQSGKLLHTYDCELGYNSARHKLFAGDGSTPEGKYQVIAVKSRGSKYYKALLLNYPNQSDRKWFEENRSKGIISSHAQIGGFIEIHGEGGKNKDWTEGCVALTNSEMDHIMQYVTVGTPVTIVRRSDLWP
jgi:L,D-peptidoglycan transpeptidase YkuD (ErfK/YbiS/YcfS/YnhG family)